MQNNNLLERVRPGNVMLWRIVNCTMHCTGVHPWLTQFLSHHEIYCKNEVLSCYPHHIGNERFVPNPSTYVCCELELYNAFTSFCSSMNVYDSYSCATEVLQLFFYYGLRFDVQHPDNHGKPPPLYLAMRNLQLRQLLLQHRKEWKINLAVHLTACININPTDSSIWHPGDYITLFLQQYYPFDEYIKSFEEFIDLFEFEQLPERSPGSIIRNIMCKKFEIQNKLLPILSRHAERTMGEGFQLVSTISERSYDERVFVHLNLKDAKEGIYILANLLESVEYIHFMRSGIKLFLQRTTYIPKDTTEIVLKYMFRPDNPYDSWTPAKDKELMDSVKLYLAVHTPWPL